MSGGGWLVYGAGREHYYPDDNPVSRPSCKTPGAPRVQAFPLAQLRADLDQPDFTPLRCKPCARNRTRAEAWIAERAR